MRVTADTSGQVAVVVWNAACVRYFVALQLGDVVALSGFRLKRATGTNEPELAINASNPTGIIVKLARMHTCLLDVRASAYVCA